MSKEQVMDNIESRILEVRGKRVVLDRDLARLYGVTTFRFNEAVKRNRKRFPPDFAFQLVRQELTHLISQNAISNTGHGGVRKLPWVFTEHGVVMAANVLRSEKAVQMSVFIVRAFVKMREQLSTTHELARRLSAIERKLILHDTALVDLYEKLKPLLLPPNPPRKQIGFTP